MIIAGCHLWPLLQYGGEPIGLIRRHSLSSESSKYGTNASKKRANRVTEEIVECSCGLDSTSCHGSEGVFQIT